MRETRHRIEIVKKYIFFVREKTFNFEELLGKSKGSMDQHWSTGGSEICHRTETEIVPNYGPKNHRLLRGSLVKGKGTEYGCEWKHEGDQSSGIW